MRPGTESAGPQVRLANNIGVIRLALASLVIIGHAPEQIDGSRLRDPLTQLFPALSLGHVAVLMFFAISGYLISQSLQNAPALRPYFARRVIRIFPAFAVSSVVCLGLFAPLMGGTHVNVLRAAANILTLHSPPDIPGLLPGLPYPALNGSMWTIAYEFRCYVLIAALSCIGTLRNRQVVAGFAATLFVMDALGQIAAVRLMETQLDRILHIEYFVGNIHDTIELTAAFLIGSVFFHFGDTLIYKRGAVSVALVGAICLALMRTRTLSDAAVITLGSYCVFWLAFRARIGALQRINDRWDISYGVYLYGWPIASLILWYDRSIGPGRLAAEALLAASVAGGLSWFLVEKPAKDLFRVWGRQHARRVVGQNISSH